MAPSQSKLTSGLYELTTQKSKKVLHLVLEWGTPKREADMTFYEYLLQVKHISMSTIRKHFNQSQRKKMEKSCDIKTFDVSLSCVCIMFGCDDLAPPADTRWTTSGNTLEWYLTSIKNCRNEFLHEEYVVDEKEFLRVIEVLRDLLNNVLKKAAEIYNIAKEIVQDVLDELNIEINNIRDDPSQLPVSDGLVFDTLCQIVKTQGKQELKGTYRKESSFGPASNLLGNLKVRVNKVFTTMSIKQESSHASGEFSEFIEYEVLLTEAERRRNEGGENCIVLLVEGPAGVGKTTLTRKMISDWASGTSTMKTLTDYEFVILFTCRDGERRSLGQLLNSLMPKVGTKIQKEHGLVDCIRQNRLLFIADGLDELNRSSVAVLREILKMGTSDDITILCTTRPNKVPDFKRYELDNFQIVHMKVLGIEENKRAEFVRNYSQALQDVDNANRDLCGLLRYLTRKDSHLKAHWRFPFNLVLVTILWFIDPLVVNSLTTATELFTKTHELCTKRLLQRLFDHDGTLDSDELKDKVEKFQKKFYKEAFINHCGEAIVLSTASVQRLKDVCSLLNLPEKEMLGAFLSQATSPADDKERYSFPHKSLQDFYSAMHVVEILMDYELGLDVSRIISGFETVLLHKDVPRDISKSLLTLCTKTLEEYQAKSAQKTPSIQNILEEASKEAAMYNGNDQLEKLDLVKNQNMFVHLTGLVHLRGSSMAETRSTELVSLLKATGIRDTSQWLDLLSEVKCNVAMIELIAKAMNLTGQLEISDDYVAAFLCVLNHVQPSLVMLDITGDPEDIPSLKDLLMAMGEKRWKVCLWFQHDFRHPREGGSVLDETLRQVFER
ncbi:uncharacterized protein LOC134776928 isoform X2 [Penaeus indicus]